MNLLPEAQKRIRFLQESNPNCYLRIKVEGGGCSGFQYLFSLDHSISDSDKIIDNLVIVDDLSLSLITGSDLDYIQDLSASKFVLSNPNASSKCGCGNSFSL